MTDRTEEFAEAAGSGNFGQAAAALNNATDSVASMLDKAQEILNAHADNIETIIAIEDAAERAQAIAAFRTTHHDGLFDAQKLGEHSKYLGIALDVFNKADTPRLPLIFAELNGFELNGTDLNGAKLGGANLNDANLSGADLCGADLCGADLSGADLSGADLSGTDLFRADLHGAKLGGANLFGANLNDADLFGANLCRANLCGAKNLTADQLRSTNIDENTQVPEKLGWVKQEMLAAQEAALAAAAASPIEEWGGGLV